MAEVSRRGLLASLFVLPGTRAAGAEAMDGWVSLFDGSSLAGWKANQAGSWRVADGAIVADGGRSHLFYTGGEFKNFELSAEVKTRPHANSGIFFHTRFQPDGWPAEGFQVEINNTALIDGKDREPQKTGSLFGVRNVYKQFVKDEEWFTLLISVRSNNVQIRLNDMLLVDYLEPAPPLRAEGQTNGRVLGRGTFALQCHDPGSKAMFRNLRVRRLPDSVASATMTAPVADGIAQQILNLTARTVPVVDYHVHLKGGWTLEQALDNSRHTGIEYGIAVNCGKGFGVTDDAGLRSFLATMKDQPCFTGMQAEGREWVKMFSPEAVAQFDYVFSDAMTFTSDDGRRMRLWIKDEVGEIGDTERFMDMVVDRIVGVVSQEPIDIYANPTFLPEAMMPEYDRYWTAPRMDRVIEAAVRSGVAIEINNRPNLPSVAFVKRAKAAGVKFSFGTNNGDAHIGRLERSMAVAEECGLTWRDFFLPAGRAFARM